MASPFLRRRGGDRTGRDLGSCRRRQQPSPPARLRTALLPCPHLRAAPIPAPGSSRPSADCEGAAAPRRALPAVNAFRAVGSGSVSPSFGPSARVAPGGSRAAMSINGGSHPRINTLGRMARAESGTDLRYEMSSHVVGGGGGGGGTTHTHKTYYYQKTYGGDYASDGYG